MRIRLLSIVLVIASAFLMGRHHGRASAAASVPQGIGNVSAVDNKSPVQTSALTVQPKPGSPQLAVREAQAQHDPPALRRLLHDTADCKHDAERNDAEIDREAERAFEQNAKARAVFGSRVPASVATPEQVRESARNSLHERRELCVSMTPADFARRVRWFEMLATSPDTKTVLELTGHDRPFDQIEIVRHAEAFARISRTFRDNFERLAASGSREALHRGRFVYGYGGWLAPPDPVRAYAFSYASARFPSDDFASSPQQVAAEAARLTPDQLAEGTRQGELLLQQCCRP